MEELSFAEPALLPSAMAFALQDYSQPIDVSGSQQDFDEMPGVAMLQPKEATFSCAVCYDDHPIEDCYIASMCRHRLCRDAAREVILAAIKCAALSLYPAILIFCA